jgi:hypothetical protein
MKSISDLLKIYESIDNPVKLRSGLIEAINKKIPIDLTEDHFKVSDNKVIFKVNPVYKSVLYINKKEIINTINNSKIHNVSITDFLFI